MFHLQKVFETDVLWGQFGLPRCGGIGETLREFEPKILLYLEQAYRFYDNPQEIAASIISTLRICNSVSSGGRYEGQFLSAEELPTIIEAFEHVYEGLTGIELEIDYIREEWALQSYDELPQKIQQIRDQEEDLILANNKIRHLEQRQRELQQELEDDELPQRVQQIRDQEEDLIRANN